MHARTPLSPDTSPEMEKIYFSLLRKKSPGERMFLAFDISTLADQMCLAGLRERYPNADERELFLRLAVVKLGRKMTIAAYGWDPEAHTS